MLSDKQGLPLSGANRAAAELFDQAVEAFNIYRGDPIALLDRAVEEAPDFAMAHILKAELYALATEPEAAAEGRHLLQRIRAMPLSARDAAHASALEHLLAGRWNDAAVALDRYSVEAPHDIVAVQIGHLVDFYRANARNLRDRLARVLPSWSATMPGYPVLLGMYAFGLEESGDYARAEATGRRAIDLQPLDCWAHHAVAHVMEMQGRAEDGLAWMATREAYWSGDDNFFKAHNWWHRALFHLDAGQADAALALYDGPVRGGGSTVALDLVDASALLWRLHLTGHDVGGRWVELSRVWDLHADGTLYPFNDWHAVMAWLGAGRDQEVAVNLSRLRATAAGGGSDTARWARDCALPLVEGFVAFWRGDHATAVDRLFGARHIANAFGGSHAQRDIIDWTLTEAALRGGQPRLGEALANERLALKPASPINRAFLTRARGAARSKAA